MKPQRKSRSAADDLCRAASRGFAMLAALSTIGVSQNVQAAVWGDFNASGAYALARGVSGSEEVFHEHSASASVDDSTAGADLAAGNLRVFGSGQAQWYDDLTFHSPSPEMGSTFPLRLTAFVAGMMEAALPDGAGASWSVSIAGQHDTLSLGVSWLPAEGGPEVVDTGTSDFVVHTASGNWLLIWHSIFIGEIDLAFETPVRVAMSLEGSNIDFSHTATFDWELPPGVSFTSASGVFLSQPESVPLDLVLPEPGGAVLLFTAFAALAVCRGHGRIRKA